MKYFSVIGDDFIIRIWPHNMSRAGRRSCHSLAAEHGTGGRFRWQSARGQAWAIYGPALYYRYTKDSKARTMFEKTLAFFLDHLPDSVIPYWDFDFTDGSTEPEDSSALAIAICGMLEMSDLTGDSELRSLASRLFGKLYESCAVKDPKISNGQLLHGVYCRKTPTNDARDRGVDECNTWGDYFYVEALMRLKRPGWRAYW